MSHTIARTSPIFRSRRIFSPRAVDAGVDPHMNTFAPSRMNKSTISMPVLRLPPVTSTTFPSKRFILLLCCHHDKRWSLREASAFHHLV